MIATKSNNKVNCIWHEDLISWSADHWKQGKAFINGEEYEIVFIERDNYGNEVWSVMKMATATTYAVTMKKTFTGKRSYYRTALACTCPAGRNNKPCKHCKAMEILIDKSEQDDFENF